MEKGNKRFLFNCDWQDILRKLGDKSRLRVLDAVVDYVRNGNVTELDLAEGIAFDFIRKEIDWNDDKYEAICERRREAGKRGGVRSGEVRRAKQNEANEANEANALNAKQTKQTKHNDNDNDNEYENDNELQLPKGNMSNLNNLSIVNNASSFASQNDPQNDPKKETVVHQALDVVAYYNSEKKRLGARLCECNTKRMTAQRLNAICARIAEYDVESVRTVVDKAMASDFLNFGANNAPVGIDWIMRPNNFPKVLEGNYDNKERTPRNGNNKSMSEDRYIGMIHTEGENDPSVWEREKEKAKQYKR